MARVFVAMSGGVDSSVAAALLLEAGHDVVGVTMQLLPSGDIEGGCCSTSAVRDAHRVCDALGIAHYTLNVRDEFRREVVEPFCDAYASGRTPNPCIVCNDRIKFAELWRRVELQGAEYLATGHYARIERDEAGEPWLARGVDPAKDQSYFLYRMTAPQLDRTLFPVGELTKSEVRRIADERGLPTADAPESQEVCFIPGGDTASFVRSARPASGRPGPIVDAGGVRIGTHGGIGGYTVGQRRGLGIAAPGPLYVAAVDAAANTLVAGPLESLEVHEIECVDAVWRGAPGVRVEAQVRYRQRALPAVAVLDGTRLALAFDAPLSGVAPGQAVVCYNRDIVLGGGVVEETA
ncbi:MAG TPA: tRNA 2-thiouridine(34) synthase MnmA [Coriobacteriia bacterium]|jgi:tRNA-specific 2-thiouridylase